jgi:hypothetical protein
VRPGLPAILCCYVDPGCGQAIGVGRTWEEARAAVVEKVSAMVDRCDPERCTPRLAVSYARHHALDGLEPVEIRAPSLTVALSVLEAMGCVDPEAELVGGAR